MISGFKTWFGLIRHGKTQWNLEKRIQGNNDLGLCPEGVDQVEKWINILKNAETWDRIVVSGLCRTWETAEIINKDLNLPIEKNTRLNEQDWGAWNGKTYQDLVLEQPKELERQMASGWRFCPPGGEDRLTVWRRSLSVFRDMAVCRPGQKILVVSHGGVIKTLIYGALKRNFLPDEPSLIKPYHLHILTWESGGLAIENLNSVCLD
jgi:broad specificity phosphatase PhoE